MATAPRPRDDVWKTFGRCCASEPDFLVSRHLHHHCYRFLYPTRYDPRTKSSPLIQATDSRLYCEFHQSAQVFDSAAIILGVILAIQIIPIGFLLQEEVIHEGWNSSFAVWYIPSAVSIGSAVCLCIWAHATGGRFIPAHYGPWRWSKTTLWIDKTCIQQEPQDVSPKP